MNELRRYIYELRDEVNRDHGVCIDLEIDQLLKAVFDDNLKFCPYCGGKIKQRAAK